eukprot:COSAG06_NODE_4438_length_4267_cov_1.083733_3_plen_64_part_00
MRSIAAPGRWFVDDHRPALSSAGRTSTSRRICWRAIALSFRRLGARSVGRLDQLQFDQRKDTS